MWLTIPLRASWSWPLGMVLRLRLLRLLEIWSASTRTRRTRRRRGSCSQPVGENLPSATSAFSISRQGGQAVGVKCRRASHINWSRGTTMQNRSRCRRHQVRTVAL